MGWKLMLSHKVDPKSPVWLDRPPAQYQSPPGLFGYSIFSRESQPKPLFVTVTGLGVHLSYTKLHLFQGAKE